ncbi:zinc metalloproteinase nas-8-like [Cimex lectularius]|uniref:Metalloendopeptidase n=1 Tax=Cimex lectularius TaxID=79782 RepID=A0A8I6RH24_CIMLE|nr:zinc metalloproteinase nas-8-like [Cimex lectularius]
MPAFNRALCGYFLCSFAFAYQELGHEVEQGLNDLLDAFGSQLYQAPKFSTGDRVANWRESDGVNPEEMGEYPEGDILFPLRDSAARNGITTLSSRWKRGKIPYVISGSFSYQDRQMLDRAFDEYARLTCIRFVPRSTETDYLYITSENTGCWSSVGKIGGAQQLNLQSPGCLTQLGTVMHELMHAIGFMHEQNRWERNRYVTIKFENIEPGKEINFEKAKRKTTDGQGIEYDYSSVMHYSGTAFSINEQPTIVAKVPGVKLGQRVNLSRKDVKKIRRMYRCNKGVSNIN